MVDVRVYVNYAKRGTIESPGTPADRYTYELKITRVSPSHGARDGGNVVNVYGVGLKEVDGVCFDGPSGGQCPSPGIKRQHRYISEGQSPPASSKKRRSLPGESPGIVEAGW